VRTWMRELGFVWRVGADGVPAVHKLRLGGQQGKDQARGEGFLESATLDGTVLPRLQVWQLALVTLVTGVLSLICHSCH